MLYSGVCCFVAEADPNARYQGVPVLWQAMQSDDAVGAVQLLLEHRADPSTTISGVGDHIGAIEPGRRTCGDIECQHWWTGS